jgi:histone-lysine N-methyltransferase SETD3
LYLFPATLPSVETDFVDGAVVAAARALPTWSDGDVPAIPSVERKSAQALQEECRQMLDSFSTTIEQDQQILGKVLHFMVSHWTLFRESTLN